MHRTLELKFYQWLVRYLEAGPCTSTIANSGIKLNLIEMSIKGFDILEISYIPYNPV